MKQAKPTKESLRRSSVTLEERLKKDLKNPRFKKAFESQYLEAAIADKLQELREKTGITQEELAGRLGVGQNAVSRIEQAKNSMTARTVRKIAAALGYEVVIGFKSIS